MQPITGFLTTASKTDEKGEENGINGGGHDFDVKTEDFCIAGGSKPRQASNEVNDGLI